MDEAIRPLRPEAPPDINAWRAYDEQRRRELEEVERQAERPVEEGKGRYVDVEA